MIRPEQSTADSSLPTAGYGSGTREKSKSGFKKVEERSNSLWSGEVVAGR